MAEPLLERKIRRSAALAALASLLIALAALAGFGILRTPDSFMYLQYAGQIRAGSLSLAGPMPVSLFRTPGFPALLAALQTVAPILWPALLISMQIAAIALTTAGTTVAAARLGAGPAAALLAGMLPSFGFIVVLEIAVIPDALYAALAALAGFALLTPGTRAALAAGLLLAAGLSLREATIVLAFFYVPLALAAPSARLPRAALLLAPPLLVAAALIAWNAGRGAGPVLTTSRQVVMLQAILPLLAHHPDILPGDDPFDRLSRDTLSGADGYGQGMDRMNDLQRRLGAAGFSAPQIATAASARYAAAWTRHPFAMLGTTISGIRHEYLAMPFQPVDTLGALVTYANRPRPEFDRLNLLWSQARLGSFTAALMIMLDVTTRLTGIAIGVAGLVLPWLPGRTARLRALWCVPVGFVAVYAPVHIETRYLAPVVPLVTVLAAAGLTKARALPLTRQRPCLCNPIS